MKAQSQITLPNEIIHKLGFREGDRFEVMERDGGVFLCPVVVYPENKIEEITKIINEHKTNPATVYDSADDMFNDLGLNIEDSNV